jgi:hypothetical protein
MSRAPAQRSYQVRAERGPAQRPAARRSLRRVDRAPVEPRRAEAPLHRLATIASAIG